jgi:hypothetical protein
LQSPSQQFFNTIPTYFPSISWYKSAVNAVAINVQTNVTYNRKWHANKANLTGANGLQSLSIPLVGGRMQKAPFAAMQISYEMDWQKNHWRSIETMYGKSPYFEYFAGDFCTFFENRFELLLDCNLASIELLNKCLHLKLSCAIDNTIEHVIDLGAPLNDLRYTQVFEAKHGFQANLSMLDFLMCSGPSSMGMLKNHI